MRKHFAGVRLRFERIVKAIDGDDYGVAWPRLLVGRPSVKNLKAERRLREIAAREKQLVKDLNEVREAIRQRKAQLLASFNETSD